MTKPIWVASTERMREAREHENDQRPGHHPLRADAVVEPAAEEGADGAGDGEQDAEQAELDRAPAEDAGRIDAAESEERHQAVGVDHVGEEEAERIAMLAHAAERRRELAEPAPDAHGRGPSAAARPA